MANKEYKFPKLETDMDKALWLDILNKRRPIPKLQIDDLALCLEYERPFLRQKLFVGVVGAIVPNSFYKSPDSDEYFFNKPNGEILLDENDKRVACEGSNIKKLSQEQFTEIYTQQETILNKKKELNNKIQECRNKCVELCHEKVKEDREIIDNISSRIDRLTRII
jgi:hypothetical protein